MSKRKKRITWESLYIYGYLPPTIPAVPIETGLTFPYFSVQMRAILSYTCHVHGLEGSHD